MKKSTRTKIRISVENQQLTVISGRKKIVTMPVSTSRFGLGVKEGSMKTPTGRFRVAEKIGAGQPIGTVFRSRKPAKAKKKLPARADLIMTRILWLDGMDPDNRNTYKRYIYIHGTNHEDRIGEPASHGCIRMRNADIMELFDLVDVETPVVIEA
jgi:lipoprotein-anchoring transpeptidase ErfK/SrfK